MSKSKEWSIAETPIVFNARFGHNEPNSVTSYSAMVEIDIVNKEFNIISSTIS